MKDWIGKNRNLPKILVFLKASLRSSLPENNRLLLILVGYLPGSLILVFELQ